MTLSYTIDRTALSRSELVITGTSSGLWVPAGGQGRPAKVWRRQTATSPFMHGTVQTGATLDQATLPFEVYAEGTSTATLHTKMDELETALFQFTFGVTVTIDAEATVWAGYCADVSWSDVDHELADLFVSKATISVPCHPVAS